MPRIALISNPKSTGNLAQLPRIRAFCAEHPDIFHYEVEQASQIGEAMRTIARIEPAVLAINGGDGTVQAADRAQWRPLRHAAPPVAVLPSGKTNLIALDLGAQGIRSRRSKSCSRSPAPTCRPSGGAGADLAVGRRDRHYPVIGMFLGGAGLADIMLYCRSGSIRSACPTASATSSPPSRSCCGRCSACAPASFRPSRAC